MIRLVSTSSALGTLTSNTAGTRLCLLRPMGPVLQAGRLPPRASAEVQATYAAYSRDQLSVTASLSDGLF